MTYRLLKRLTPADRDAPPVQLASTVEYDNQDAALTAARGLCTEFGWWVIVAQDINEVKMAPVVSSFSPPPPGQVMRLASPNDLEPDTGIPRQPKSKPRLLVVPDRRATPAEIYGNLMVVAEGRIVKNAFGALELADMPLTDEERPLVIEAMKGKGL